MASWLQDARDMGADLDTDHLRSHDEIRLSNAIADERAAIRKIRGRGPKVRQWRPDSKHYPMRYSVVRDPILDLKALRTLRRVSPYQAMTYGEVRQAVVSPVVLP